MLGIYFYGDYERKQKQLLEDKYEMLLIVTPGGIGTYEEFFEILTLKSLGRINRPIVIYNINGYYDRMKELLEYTAEQKFMGKIESCSLLFYG